MPRGKYYTKHNGPGEGVEECDKKNVRVEEKIVQGERKKLHKKCIFLGDRLKNVAPPGCVR